MVEGRNKTRGENTFSTAAPRVAGYTAMVIIYTLTYIYT
jgi:hypothetical protein